MQNVYFNEIEAAYMRRRVQDAAVASGLAAQAAPRSTRNRRPLFPSLSLAYVRVREVVQRQRSALDSIPRGRELPAG